MATTFAARPSNPNWVSEVTSSPNMQNHLAGLKLDRLYVALAGISREAGAFGTSFKLRGSLLEGKKTGIFDTDSKEFRGAVDHYVFLYRMFHPVKTISELPKLLRVIRQRDAN